MSHVRRDPQWQDSKEFAEYFDAICELMSLPVWGRIQRLRSAHAESCREHRDLYERLRKLRKRRLAGSGEPLRVPLTSGRQAGRLSPPAPPCLQARLRVAAQSRRV